MAIALLTASGAAAEHEGHRGRGRTDSERLASPPIVTAPLSSTAARPPVKLRSFAVPSDPQLDKGSIGTDASVALPLPPTSAEHAKLAAARAAVERARIAGTLLRARRPATIDPAALERIFAEKDLRFRMGRTTALAPDPAAGIGPGLIPVQKQGQSGLTAAEKLKAEQASRAEAAARTPHVPSNRPEQGGR